jgi:Mn-dependent DtxR family transcriptional regulator
MWAETPRPHGISPLTWFPAHDSESKPWVRPLEAAEIMLLDPSTVTRLVEKLQSKGLVTRKNSGTYLSGSITAPSASRAHRQTMASWLVSTLAVNRTKKADSRCPV